MVVKKKVTIVLVIISIVAISTMIMFSIYKSSEAYWISLWSGIAAGILISLYGIRRAKRKIDAFARIYPCDASEKQEIAKQNHKWFLSYIFLIIAMVVVCATCRFLMIWVVPSVLVYAFFHSLMCMLTVLLTGAFVGNRPLKGWKIADKMGKGEI